MKAYDFRWKINVKQQVEEVEKSLRETPLSLPLGQIGNFVG